jgi:hypothetical protein
MRFRNYCFLVTVSAVIVGCGPVDFTVEGEAHSTIPDCTVGGSVECGDSPQPVEPAKP